MKRSKIILTILIFGFLTVLTQIGGLVYLLALKGNKYINALAIKNVYQHLLKFLVFFSLYCIATFLIVPIIAKPLGRVRLPLTQTENLQPLNFMTCFLNRNYVRPELKQTILEVAAEMAVKHPGTVTNYLDANFPFINKFPLLPHLSHNDGKKLDLSFCYTDTKTGKQTNENPSLIGYGICEEALPNEKNTADFCSENGYWQYSFLKVIIPQSNKKNYTFDTERTKTLVTLCTLKPAIAKIFIEPHLKTRLQLTSEKIRFHGCQAVRHDDHIHIQIK